MRLSSDPNDIGYDSNIATAVSKVLLDGELIDYCITADEETGYVKYYPIDSKGNGYSVNGELQTLEMIGEVKIVFREGFSEKNLYRNVN